MGAGHRAAEAHGIDALLDADLNDQAERLAQAMIDLLERLHRGGLCARQRRSDVRRHATLPQAWIQPEEFETHRHVRLIVHEYVEHDHRERHHQGLDNQLLQRSPPPVRSVADVQRRERLGGLLSFYYREAA